MGEREGTGEVSIERGGSVGERGGILMELVLRGMVVQWVDMVMV